MTIVKIKNPVLRWLVGFMAVIVIILLAAAIFWGIGILVKEFLPDSPFGDLAIKGFPLIIVSGIWLSSCIGLAILIMAGLFLGAKAFGNKFLDP